ncbi:MAG TPA: hypothetical protein GX504_00895 [Clostridia bacterium]|nr:hypothetical protein [Clostridia bacterium]
MVVVRPVREDDYSTLAANLCASEVFLALRKELEQYYGGTEPEETAFHDALYALMAEAGWEAGHPLVGGQG